MLEIGEQIDIWVVERPLGQGGMGSVYRCHNREARRILAAVKVLDGELKRNHKARQRFIREAEILYAIDHPNIVKVRNIRIDADPPYLEMEFVEGESLEGLIANGPVAVPRAARMLRQLSDALAYLHERGIRHRDIKPSNILVRHNGDAVLVDFGIAAEVDSSTLTDRGGQAFGSPSYVPPEWARPGELDAVRWDIYALGISIYEALTGSTAFRMPSEGVTSLRFLQVLSAKQNHPPLDPGPDVPVALRRLVDDMTNSDWRQRIGTAAELVARVDALDLATIDREWRLGPRVPPPEPTRPAGRTIVAPEPEGPPRAAVTMPPEAVPATGSSRGWMGALAAVGLGLVVGGGTLWWQSSAVDEPPAAASPAVARAPDLVREEVPVAAAVVDPPVDGRSKGGDAPVKVEPAPKVEAPAPEVEAPASKVEPPAPRVEEAPVAAVGTSGRLVDNRALSAWLVDHSQWQTGDGRYLQGWTGTTPPAGKEDAAATAVSFAVARAYCERRGGVADVAAAPTTWDLSKGPWHEYRTQGGAARLLRNDGMAVPQPDETATKTGVGFRCAR